MTTTLFRTRRGCRLACIAMVLGTASAAHASAPPTLTANGIALGFTLTSIVTGFSPDNSSYNVLGSAVNSDGNIIVNVARQGMNYVFRNLDNQTPADALSSTSFSGLAARVRLCERKRLGFGERGRARQAQQRRLGGGDLLQHSRQPGTLDESRDRTLVRREPPDRHQCERRGAASTT